MITRGNGIATEVCLGGEGAWRLVNRAYVRRDYYGGGTLLLSYVGGGERWDAECDTFAKYADALAHAKKLSERRGDLPCRLIVIEE